jgi:1-acyl-sn-glycerol-3-phosphate acyltransferase
MVQARLELLRAGRIAGFGALTATLLSAFALRHRLAPDNERYDLQNLWVGRWSRALLTLFGVDLRVYGQVSPPKGCGRVIISNHRSTLDVGVLLSIFGGHMVSRADLARWPLMGLAAREAGTIFVDRANAASGAGAIRAMTEVLRRGHTVVVFAEGTTFADDEVRPFHGGAFVAAVVAKAEVLPVGLAYAHAEGYNSAAFVNETFTSHLARMAASPSTRVVLHVGTPLRPDPKVRSTALRDQTHHAVQALVREARGLCDGR